MDDRPTIPYADAQTPRPAPPLKDYGHVAFSHETCALLEQILLWVGVALGIIVVMVCVYGIRGGFD